MVAKHGMWRTPEHSTWCSMRTRCDNQNVREYSRYGGRGIKVCDRWSSFENFYADMGPRPSPQHSIDRIDNEKGYEPGNVRWATRLEQNRNRRGFATETHCRRGHVFTEATAYINPAGKRECRICRNASAEAYKARKKEVGHARG